VRIVRFVEEARRQQRILRKSLTAIEAGRGDSADTSPGLIRFPRFPGRRVVTGVLGVVAVTFMIATAWWWGAHGAAERISERLETLEALAGSHTRELADIQKRISVVQREGDLADLNARVTVLSRSLGELNRKLALTARRETDIAAVEADEIAATPGNEQETDTMQATSGDEQSQLATPESRAPATPDPEAAATVAVSPSSDTNGRWAINLLSGQNAAAIDRFVAKAQSRGIRVEKLQVSVKGKTYWRVRISGFPTADEARARSGPVKETLGLKSVWITRR